MTAARREVVFVGGTLFSGAETLAALLGELPETTALPAARFHSDPWGIPALLHGRIGIDDFIERLRADGVADRVRPGAVDSALAGLRATYDDDPLRACRELVWALFGELAPEGARGPIVEASPGNLLEAQTLLRLAPESTFVHAARDGRDVAAAAMESDEVAVGSITEGLDWWAAELREIERGVRGEEDGAPYAIPPDRLAVIVVDELVGPAGDAAYRALLRALPLGEDGRVPDPPSPVLDPAVLGRGRWGDHVRGPGRWLATRRYERVLSDLEEEGNHAAPALRAAYDRLG